MTESDETTTLEDMDPQKVGFDLYVAWFLKSTAAAIVYKDYDHPEEVLGCVTNIATVFRRPAEEAVQLHEAVGRLSTRAFGYERTLVREAIIGKKVYPAEYRVKVWAR